VIVRRQYVRMLQCRRHDTAIDSSVLRARAAHGHGTRPTENRKCGAVCASEKVRPSSARDSSAAVHRLSIECKMRDIVEESLTNASQHTEATGGGATRLTSAELNRPTVASDFIHVASSFSVRYRAFGRSR
jgi:hypothetical protein